MIGVNKGYRVVVCVPEKFAEEKVKIMRALGAEVVRTPDEAGMQGAIAKAKELAANIPVLSPPSSLKIPPILTFIRPPPP